MSRPMSFSELKYLLEYIQENNSPGKALPGNKRKVIKYVDPVIDMRSGAVFAVKFRMYFSEHVIHTQNECRDLPDNLLVRCLRWVNEPAE